MKYDLVVIGAGPAGYVGALRAAQLGKKTACIEKERVGGTCLNWGCIPTKALLRSAELHEQFKRAEEFGFSVQGVSFDMRKIVSRSRAISDRMARGIEYLLKTKKVDSIVATASIGARNKIKARGNNGIEQTLEADHILVATGARSRHIPGLPVDGKRVLTSREALAVDRVPESLIVIGAGAIGVEFAYFFSAFGTKVTLVEMLPRILPVEDHEISELLAKNLRKAGLEILTETRVENAKVGSDGVEIQVNGKESKILRAEMALVAIGVQPSLEGLLDDGLKLDLDDKGYIKTNERYETSLERVYAAGDIIGPPWLAHVASHEAIEAVEGMFVPGKKPKKVTMFPGCTYCQPQVASMGLTENQAKEQGIRYKVGKFPYRASGRAVASGLDEGFIKLIVAEPHGELLGAHIIGSEATELIAESALAITLEATLDDLTSTIHAHPTLSEMTVEATLASRGQALHI
jgi:dihydrolipoamide dehydrogenase